MTFLMVNLEDPADCRKAMHHLRGIVNPGGPGGRRGGPGRHGHSPEGRMGECKPGPLAASEPSDSGVQSISKPDEKAALIRGLPLRAKLERMSQRGVWRYLVAIAKQGDVAKSLAELDKQLDLQPNKMRSLKAIMAKLENRFGLRFLEVDVDAGNDEAGNPRYSMPHRVRKQILRIATES